MKRHLSLIILLILIMSLFACTERQDDLYGTYYELFVRSFYDSNGDGDGDLAGVTEKLDYLQTDLGVNGIWLMPIMPSPSYHKYDVTNYTAIDPQYGTLADFDVLTAKAEKQHIKVIIDLVLNHTSTKHPWFQSAVKSLAIEPCGQEICIYTELCRTHNPYVTYYHFTTNPTGKGYYALGMPKGWSYEAVFWDQMPDLNLDDPRLREELLTIAQFWIDHGVDGFRLDAVLHFYSENAPQNIAFLKWFKENTTALKSDIYLIGEAWSDPTTIGHYYDSQIDSLFNFPLSGSTGSLVETIRSSKGKELITALDTYQEKIKETAPSAIDAVFLSNHDQGRSAGYLMGDLVKEKMAASLYLLLPGNSFMYYGEEIGMFGSGKDENKRTPLIWSVDSPQGITTPVEGTESVRPVSAGIFEQMKDKNSLWRHYQKILKLKNKNPEISRGDLTAIDFGDTPLFGYRTTYNNDILYVIHNFTSETQIIELSENQYSNAKIISDLSTSENMSSLDQEILTMPPFSTVVVK